MNGTPSAPQLLEAARLGDERACEQVLEENNGLIWSIVRRYYGRGVEPDDLYQLGCLGFLKAVRGYDPAFGTQFSTYAVPKIAGEIRRFLRDDGAVKVSRGMKERGVLVRGLRSRLCAELGREPALSELAEAAGLTPRPRWEAVGNTALLQAAAAGLGLAVLSRQVAAEAIAQGKVGEVAVEGLVFRRQFRVVWHREKVLSPLARDLLQVVLD